MKEGKRLTNLTRRIIAFVLAVLLVFDMNVTGLLRTMVFGVSDDIQTALAAPGKDVEFDDFDDLYIESGYTVASADGEIEKADVLAHNYFEFQYIGGSTYSHNYCSTYNDKRKGLDIIRQENNMINKIKVLNGRLDGNAKITYDTKGTYASYNQNGKIISRQNYLAGGHGFIVKDATTVDDISLGFLPASLKIGKRQQYTRGVLVNDLVEGNQKSVEYNISIKVDSITGANSQKGLKVSLKDSMGKAIAEQICSSAGQTLTMSGNVDINKISKDASDGFKYLYLELSSFNNADIKLSNLKFLLPSKETMLEEAYLTNLPVPAGDTPTDGLDHKGIVSYTKADFDDMYVVLRFDGPVKLGKMLYSDEELIKYKEKHYGVYRQCALRAYPRLALSITESSGVEQNTKNSTIFADYCGTMSSVNFSGSKVDDSCLIFKLDLDEKWKYTSFSIPALSKQITRTGRDGNMEWINECQKFDEKQRNTFNGIFTRRSLQLGVNDRMYKGAIKDANGNRIVVEEGFPLQPVAGKDYNGNDVKRMPTYDGSVPKIKEINIRTDNKSGYVKKGDSVGIDVVFNCKLDTSVPAPTFYLNEYLVPWVYVGLDYKFNEETKKYCTKVSGGEYTNARMEPLNASLRISKDDAANRPFLDAGEAAPSIGNNKRGAAYMTITGAKSGEEYKTFYKIVRESSEIRNIGETFDPSGWTVYNGKEVRLTNLPTALYRRAGNGSSLERAADGGFVDICVAKLDETNKDSNGNPQYTIVKYGESDEINTTSDSESAMKQINNEADSENTVIHYQVPISGRYSHAGLNLVCCDEDGTYDPNSIYFEGTVKNLAGDEMTHTKNFGVFHYNEYNNQMELINDWKAAIIPQNTNVSYDQSAPTVRVIVDGTYSDDINAVSKALLVYYNSNDFCMSPMTAATLKIGNVSEKIHIKVTAPGVDKAIFDGIIEPEKNSEDGSKGKDYAKEIRLDTTYWESGEVEVEANRVENSKNGERDDVIVPITLEGADVAGNVNSHTDWMRFMHPYINSRIKSDRTEPVVRKYTQQADEQKSGNITLQVFPEYKSTSYDVGNYELYLLDPSDLGLKRNASGELEIDGNSEKTLSDVMNIDYNTLLSKGKPVYKLQKLDDPEEANDENGGYKNSEYKLACRYLQGDETKDVAIRTSFGKDGYSRVYDSKRQIYDLEDCDEMIVSIDVPVRVAFDKIAYAAYHDNNNGLTNVVYKDVYMDTSDAGPIESIKQEDNRWVETFVEYTKADEDSISIDYAPGSFLEDGSGRLKRTNSYKFTIKSTSDVYWNAGNYNFQRNDGMPGGGRLIGGRLKASEDKPLDIVFDTNAIPLEYLWTPEEGGLQEEELEVLRTNGIIYTKADGKEYMKLSCSGDYIVGADGDKYGSLGVFGGAAWLWKCDVSFSPYTTKITRHYIHNVTFNDDGSVKEDNVTENVQEQIGEEIPGEAKKYTLEMLDEEFVKRGPKYVDLNLQYQSNSTYGSYSNTNKLFMEFDPEYNSLNGYDGLQDSTQMFPKRLSRAEPVTFVLGENASELINPDTDIDFANSYIEIWPVEETELGSKIYYYKKVGDKPVRTIPLPQSFEDVSYKRAYSDEEIQVKGITADINAYEETEIVNEDGTKSVTYTIPKDGTYAAYVHIATYLTDKNGEQVVVTSKDHYRGQYKNKTESGRRSETDNADKMEQVEVPLAIYTYDQTAPDFTLAIGKKTETRTVTYDELKQWKIDNDINIQTALSDFRREFYAEEYDRYVESYNEYKDDEKYSQYYPAPQSSKEDYVEFNCLLYLWSEANDVSFSYWTDVEKELEYEYTVRVDESKDVYQGGEDIGTVSFVMNNEPKINNDDYYTRRIVRYAFVTDEFIDGSGNLINDKVDEISDPLYHNYKGYEWDDAAGDWVQQYEDVPLADYLANNGGSGSIDIKTDDEGRPTLNNWGYNWDNNSPDIELTLPECKEGCDNVYLVAQAMDEAGNESGYYVRKFAIDNKAPTAELYSVIKPNKDDPDDSMTEKKYVRPARIKDNYSGLEDITVVLEKINDSEHTFEKPVLLKDYSKWIGVGDTISIKISDAIGNEREITLADDTEVNAPVVTAAAGGTDATKVSMVTSGDIETGELKNEQNSYDGFKNIDYAEGTANNTLEFELDINSGNDDGYAPTVEYAFSSDTYKLLYSEDPADDTGDYTNMWQEGSFVNELPDKAPGNGMVNLVYSYKKNGEDIVNDKYIARANILLPAADTARNYVLTFRFGNGTGQYVYKTVGYTVPALPGGNRISIDPDATTNAQTLIFNEPLRVLTMAAGDSDDDPAEYATSTKVYFDTNGKYTVNYVDLLGNKGKQTLELTGIDKSWVPDVERTYNEDGTVTIELDSGYKNAYGMIFDNLAGEGYEVELTDDELRQMTVGEGESEVTVYKYAKVTAAGNASFTFKVYSPDDASQTGYKINTFTYDVGGFSTSGHEYELQYSRNKVNTDSANRYDPVDVRLIIPEGAEILSADGDAYTFLTNGTYKFTVKYSDGYVLDIPAEVDCISEREPEGIDVDNVAPVINGINYYIRNDAETIDISDKATENGVPAEAGLTNSKVYAKILAMDMNSEDTLNPLTVTLTGDDALLKKVVQDENDPLTLIFSENATAEVVISDPAGNETSKQFITVENITDKQLVTGSIRYVRCGLTQTKAYIDMPEGVSLRDMNGIQTLPKTGADEGKFEYYHLFTQSGTYTFKLTDGKGNIADITTRQVDVDREPLILDVSGRTPEKPGWGEPQMVEVSSNLALDNVLLLNSEGKKSDMSLYVKEKKAYINFTRNETLRFVAEAVNGSKAELTVSGKNLRENPEPPRLTLDKEYVPERNMYKITARAIDVLPVSSYDEDCDIHIEPPKEAVEFSEGELVKDSSATTMTLTREAEFYVTESGTYTVKAYNVAAGADEKTVDVTLDTTAPEITVTEDTVQSTLIKKVYKVSINEDGYISYAGERNETVSGEDAEGNVTSSISGAVKAGEIFECVLDRNGTVIVTASDKAGNEATAELKAEGLDEKAPVITVSEGDIVINRDDVTGSTASAKESELKNLLAEYFEVSDDLSAPEEITKNINKLNGVIDASRGVVNNGTYSAEAEAVDKAGRKSSVSFVFKVTGAEVKTYPELKSFGINGQELKENGYAAYDDTTLTLSGVPDKATVYYAKDDYTGAQMKYKGTVLSGNMLSVEKGYTYTIMLKLKDKSIHIYHVIAR